MPSCPVAELLACLVFAEVLWGSGFEGEPSSVSLGSQEHSDHNDGACLCPAPASTVLRHPQMNISLHNAPA